MTIQRSPSLFARRGVVILACAVVLATSFFFLSGRGWPTVAYHLLTDGLIALLWLLSACGWGELIFRSSPPIGAFVRTRALRCVCAAALGIGAMSLVVLALGLIGGLGIIVSWVIVIVGASFALRFAWPIVRDVNQSSIARWLVAPAGLSWAWIALMPMLAVVIVATDVPPGVLWGDEPKGYDVVEYHLQVPREWFESGRITPLSHNVFSYMPMGVEMHYLLAMHLRGGPWDGMYLAQLMHALMMLLAVISAGAIAGEALESEAAGTIAALAMSSAPWLMLLAPIAYNESGLLLFGTLAIGLTWLSIRGGRDGRHHGGAAILAGAMSGFACGVKLTAVPMLLVAIPIAHLCSAGRLGRSSSSRDKIGRDGRHYRNAMVLIVAGFITFSPWLIRNLVWTGNPVFPEATSIFGSKPFSDTQAERWTRAHSPPSELRPIAMRAREAWRQIAIDWRYGYVLLPLALAAAVLRWRASDAKFLLIFFALALAFWIGATHLQSRFFVLAIPAAALSVAALDRWPRWLLACALAISALVGFARWEITYDRDLDDTALVLRTVRETPAFGLERLELISGIYDLLSSIPEEKTIAFVGDAKPFLFSRPMTKLRYRTVFDIDAKPNETAIDAWLPRDLPADAAIIVDPNELNRFAESKGGYYAIPKAQAEVSSRGEPFILRR